LHADENIKTQKFRLSKLMWYLNQSVGERSYVSTEQNLLQAQINFELKT